MSRRRPYRNGRKPALGPTPTAPTTSGGSLPFQVVPPGTFTRGMSHTDRLVAQALQMPWVEGEMAYYDSLQPDRYRRKR